MLKKSVEFWQKRSSPSFNHVGFGVYGLLRAESLGLGVVGLGSVKLS